MQFGDVVLVPFPFTSQVASKQRPAVIISSRAYNLERPDLIIMAITSQLRPTPLLGEVWLRQWQSAGLLKPSAVKPVIARSNWVSSSANSASSMPPTRAPFAPRSARSSANTARSIE